MRHLVFSLLPLLLSVMLGACAQAHDLDAPCPDFGRFCAQKPVNEPLF